MFNIRAILYNLVWSFHEKPQKTLVLSCFASGFGLCSVIFATFTLSSQLTLKAVMVFLLSLVFFLINLLFAARYYNLVAKQLNQKKRHRMEAPIDYYRS